MSAFVVGENTMDRVVAVICGETRWGYMLREFAGTRIPDNPEAMTEIGRKLYAMNCWAVGERYPDCKGRDLPGIEGGHKLPTKYKFRGERLRGKGGVNDRDGGMDWIQNYKSLICLVYQCSEGDIEEREPHKALYAELAKVCGILAEHILARTPEYDAAEWD